MEGQDHLLIEFLAMGGRKCSSCAYALEGLQSARCPECGETLVLALRGESNRRSSWLIGLIAWSIGFGLFGVFVPLTALVGAGPPARMWALYIGAVLTWPGVILWLLFARWYPRWPSGVRRALTIASVALVAVLMLGAVIQIS